ncbi:hypothetical protein GXW83_21105 [Streptacidiphilus sp. PB12-B1b]|uniref:hypothetical protein n=1 Tax=Streptacidiphilus sp. PB12-B1b TaxID=2705012 RepID=UPI0015FC1EDD|nr:hypothetical protein [Streptacidiphilus sp. PB12-B1b]QMU77816.1 hypothetical protein GXW83_21105 [Streptacidiphilus sp. PB12-B1b]
MHARPTDPCLRRRHGRIAVLAAAVAAVLAAALASVPGAAVQPAADPAPPGCTLAAHPELPRTPADSWQDTARLDFTAWPARGAGTDDRALVADALAAWCRPALVHAEAGAAAAPPGAPPRLLWAGQLDGAGVVLLDDGSRLARYTRPDHPGAADPDRVEISRDDDSDVTTAGAVLLRSTPAGDRFLIAPWVQQVQLRDLRAPDTAGRELAVPADGVTPPVPAPPGSGCGSWPVLQLRSSPVVAEHHAFLLTDLGTVVPAHLTYQPPPQAGPAQSPREATGPSALLAWDRLACLLPTLRQQGVKSVNAWQFAVQQLPGSAGQASWVCSRADRWDGTGSAATEFLTPVADTADEGAPAAVTARQPQGRACSRFEQYVLAATWWRAPDGRSYLLAAGSRHVVRMAVSGAAVLAASATPQQTAAVPAARTGPVSVSGYLDTGLELHPMG